MSYYFNSIFLFLFSSFLLFLLVLISGTSLSKPDYGFVDSERCIEYTCLQAHGDAMMKAVLPFLFELLLISLFRCITRCCMRSVGVFGLLYD